MSTFERMWRNRTLRVHAWMLMIVAVLAIVPRGSMHTCARSGEHVGHAHTSAITSVCPICEEAVPVSALPERVTTSEPMPALIVHVASHVPDPALVHVVHGLDRGPPMGAA